MPEGAGWAATRVRTHPDAASRFRAPNCGLSHFEVMILARQPWSTLCSGRAKGANSQVQWVRLVLPVRLYQLRLPL